jgi:hypothetical protein
MDTWAWLFAYLVGFALLQFVLYRYLQSGESTHDGDREPGHRRIEQSLASSGVGRDTDDDGVSCPQCATPNDRSYRYCRNCVEPLR